MSSFEAEITNEDLFKLAQFFSNTDGTCFLYSGGSYDSSERSFLFLFPYEKIEILNRETGWEVLKDRILSNEDWVGFFGYEMGATSDPEKRLDLPKAATPEAYFQRTAVKIEYDHRNQKAFVHCLEDKGLSGIENFSTSESFSKFLDSLSKEKSVYQGFLVKSPEPIEQYVEKIKQAKELIWNGEIYQVNLSHQVDFTGEGDPFSVFYHLVQINPAPFSAYLRLMDFTIVSSSPERLLQKRGNHLETRPIKGTIVRGKTELEDAENKNALLDSIKDRAELLMITDLMRNDLGKISQPGSVITEKLVQCETYANLFHLHSIIRSKSMNVHAVDILRSCFPGGSVTGCPKLRAMEVIAELEKRPRGIYTGSIGYFSANGDFDFNIAIRTIVFSGNKCTLQLGGAIVTDSIPEKEYEETLAKGSLVMRVLTGAY